MSKKAELYIEDFTRHYWFRVSKDKALYITEDPDEENVYDGADVFDEDNICFDSCVVCGDHVVYAYSDEGFVAFDLTLEITAKEIKTHHWRYGDKVYIRYKE